MLVPNELNDPRINLAIEIFLLQEMKVDEPILLFTLMNHRLSLDAIKIRSKRSIRNMWMNMGSMSFVGSAAAVQSIMISGT